jgi:hypothetical protein
MKKTPLSIAAAITVFAVSSSAALAGPPLTYSPDQVVFGNKMNEWSAEWWQYILSIPTSVNPLVDPTNNCMVAQHGPVWFLVGAANATCSIPQGKALFFPILNLVDVNTTNQSVAQLRAEIAPCMTGASNLTLHVDGQYVAIGSQQHVLSVPFAITLPADNLFGLPSGIYSPAVDDGYYVMLKPLAVGPHTITFTGNSPGCLPFTGPFSVNVTYTLNVVAVALH